MDDYGGYLMLFDEPGRTEMLTRRLESGGTFTDAFSILDWGLGSVELCFLCLNKQEIHYAALVRGGRRVATAKCRVEFTHILRFEPALSVDEIENNIHESLQPFYFRVSVGHGIRISPETWQKLLSIIKLLRSGSKDRLERLEKLLEEYHQSFEGESFGIMTHQKDAVGLALEIAGFERKTEVVRWKQEGDGALASFLKGFPDADFSEDLSKLKKTGKLPSAPLFWDLVNVELREDKMVEHDAQFIPGWKFLSRLQVGAAIFERDNQRLTVMDVNRTPIERVLGVDLLYYHCRFESYVAVQYKRMIKENSEWIYRPDEQLMKELERMEQVEAITRDEPTHRGDVWKYRLHSSPFYLKLCPAVTFEPFSPDLIKGMYIPFDYWRLLMRSGRLLGPRDGTVITWDNVDRHLNNTLFVQLVQDGWIGSKGCGTETVASLIRQSLQGQRSVILAIDET